MRTATGVLLFIGFATGVTAVQNQEAPGLGQAKIPTLAPGAEQPAPKAKSGKIDINSATKKQLLTLPGIDDALAAKIITGRPYKTVAELKTKRVLLRAAYNKISSRIVAASSTAQGTGEWTGRVSTGLTAVGGETTGIVLTTANDLFELQPADQSMRTRLQDLDGKLVTIRGRLEERRGIEVRLRRIVQVDAIIPQ